MSSLLVALGYALWLPFHDSTTQALVNMAVVGVGSGALVAALPASAAAGAPPERTGFATGMTNATKTIGGAIASSIFAIALASTGSLEDPTEGHAPLSGYLTVWSVCAVAALLAAVALLMMPKVATSLPSRPRVRRREPTTSLAPRRPLLTAVLGVLGALVLLFALGRPSVGRFLAAGMLLGAAAVVRYNSLRRDDPARYGRAAQIRSLVWSVVIVVVFVGRLAPPVAAARQQLKGHYLPVVSLVAWPNSRTAATASRSATSAPASPPLPSGCSARTSGSTTSFGWPWSGASSTTCPGPASRSRTSAPSTTPTGGSSG